MEKCVLLPIRRPLPITAPRKLLHLRQILRPIGIKEIVMTQPASIELIPEHQGIDLPGELVHDPGASPFDPLAGRIVRNAVERAQRGDLVKVFADVHVLKGDMIRVAFLPASIAAASRIKPGRRHHEFRKTRNRRGDAPGFVRCQMRVAIGICLQVVATVDGRQRDPVGIANAKTGVTGPFNGPGCRKPPFLPA